MWRLIRAELTRLRWRRAILALVAAGLLIPAAIAASHAWNTRPVSPAELAEAQREMDEYRAMDLETCLENPRNWNVKPDLDADVIESKCNNRVGNYGSAEDWLSRPVLDLEEARTGSALAAVTVLTLIAVLVGTTFVGHDWATGSMSNQLLFESRRGRVWWAKAIAVGIGAAMVAVIALALLWTVLATTASARGITTPDAVWSEIGWGILRSLVLVTGAALVAYALTTLFRSTVGALGLMFAATMLSTIVLATMGLGEKWMLPSNAWAFVLDGYEYWDDSARCTSENDCYATITLSQSSVYLGMLVALSVALSLLSFRRRDVP